MEEDILRQQVAAGRAQLNRLSVPIFWEAERQIMGATRAEYGCLLLIKALHHLGMRMQQQEVGIARVLGHLQQVGMKTEAALAQTKQQRRAKRKQQRQDTKRRKSR